MDRGNPKSSHQRSTSFSTDLSHLPDEFVRELVWENDQIKMQGQTGRARRSINSNSLHCLIPEFQDQDSGTRRGKNGLMGCALENFTPTIPSFNLGLDQDDEMDPWLNYNDPLHYNFFSGSLLPEVSSITINDFSHQNNNPSVARKGILKPTFEGNQPLAPSLKSCVSDAINNSVVGQASWGCFNSNTSSSIINFSHFSRPVALATRSVSAVGTANSSGMDKMGHENKGNFVPIGNEMGSASLLQKMVSTRKLETPQAAFPVKKDPPLNQVDSAVACKMTCEVEKSVEPIVASSSLCSGNNPEQVSDVQNHNLKRKSIETDNSEGRSEDLEEESVGKRKSAPLREGRGTKRSRAAEVHNLSERRRRDRINEKMRALQELVPNCNKADKASMLDEAIEYLKALQLQVQMMSMGPGLFMPQMMYPTSIQHIMPHFTPMMGIGMPFHSPQASPFSGHTNIPMVFSPPGAHQPSVPISAGPSVNYGFGVASHMEIPVSAPFSTDVANDQALYQASSKELHDALPS